MEEPPLKLKSLHFVEAADPKNIVLKFMDEGENFTCVEIERQQMREFTGELIKFTTSLRVDDVMARLLAANPPPAPALPATDMPLLLGQTLRLVRWRTGGAILLATTTEGFSVQLALSPHLKDALHDALETKLPPA